jgi:phage terminase large subunit-like protein
VTSAPEEVARLGEVRDRMLEARRADAAAFAAFLRDARPSDLEAVSYCWPLWARPDQLEPAKDGGWDDWLLLAGRGFGKTRTGAEQVIKWAREQPGCRVALVGRVPKDVRDVMIEGESGIMACSPGSWRPEYNSSTAQLVFPNGSRAYGYSGEVPDDLRGPQFHKAWVDEWCKMRFAKEVKEQIDFSVRLGSNTQRVWTTTPRPMALLRELMAEPGTVTTRGSTFANRANMDPKFFARLLRKYEGTTLGQQELYALVLDESKGALWKRSLIDRSRAVTPPTDGWARLVVAVDPSVTTTEESDETGIVVVGIPRGQPQHAYVVADLSYEGGLKDAAPVVLAAWRTFKADLIVGEVNNGGDLIEHTLRTTEDPRTGKPAMHQLPYKMVRATKGKRKRAEPVAMLYEQNLVHHVGTFAELEDQMCTWVPDPGHESDESPDRMDALVWALTELLVQPDPEVRVRRFK